MLYTFEVSLFPRRRITYTFIENEKAYTYSSLLERLNRNGI